MPGKGCDRKYKPDNGLRLSEVIGPRSKCATMSHQFNTAERLVPYWLSAFKCRDTHRAACPPFGVCRTFIPERAAGLCPGGTQ